MNLPGTLLSLVYHGTIRRYRDEMHAHPNQAFERFRITGSKLRDACLAVDGAAFELRSNPHLPAAQTKLEETSKILFERLESVLASEVANGVPGPNQEIDGEAPNARLLTGLYRLMYCKTFREGNPDLPATLPALPASTPAESAAWDAIKAARAAGGGEFAELLPHAQVLCRRMKAEFDEDIWTFIW
jgi:hypothetical protein